MKPQDEVAKVCPICYHEAYQKLLAIDETNDSALWRCGRCNREYDVFYMWSASDFDSDIPPYPLPSHDESEDSE